MRLREPSTLLRLGAAFLLLAGLLRFAGPADGGAPSALLDGAFGFANGLAIGFMLWSVLERRRLGSAAPRAPCSWRRR